MTPLSPATHRASALLAPLVVAIALAASCAPPSPAPQEVVLFATASAGQAVKSIVAQFERDTGRHVTVHLASTATLATQVKEGAAADVFLSADQRWMDDLAAAGLLRAGTRRDLLANELVLIGSAATTGSALISVSPGAPPQVVAAATRVALADPSTVPAGRYAREALTFLGWWDAIEAKVITGTDAPATLALVEMGEAELGVVYATDARSSRRVTLLATFPPESHTPIIYPIALTVDAREGSAELVAYLNGDAARATFEGLGFRVVDAP